jgi:RNA polymerase sigma-70 factor (ECF subfamily)
MIRFADWLGHWSVDVYLLTAVLLLLALTAMSALRQPVHRLAVGKSTLIALALLAALCAIPGWSVFHLITAQPVQRTDRIEKSMPGSNVSSPVIASPHPEEEPTLASPFVPISPRVPNPWRNAVSGWSIIGIVELAGAVAIAIWLTCGWLEARKLCRNARPAPAEIQALLAEAPLRNIGLQISDHIDVPVALGLFHPAILLPAHFLETQSAIQNPKSAIASVLAHELAHIRNHDLHWLALSRALLAILWSQPLFWLTRRRTRLDQESLADAAAAELTTREQYAEQLVAWARGVSRRPALHLSSAIGLWEGRSQLRRRITMLLDDRIPLLRRSSRSWSLASFAMTALASVMLSLFTLAPAHTESPTRNELTLDKQATGEKDKKHKDEFSVIFAKHVILLNGNQIVTWDDLINKIAALPNPSKAQLHFYFTNGALEAGEQQAVKDKIYTLSKQFNLHGHSEGSLLPRAGARYDRIEKQSDLTPDPSLRITGTVVDKKDQPVAGAEVVLIAPVDELLPYKDFDIVMVQGRIRNPLDEIISVSDEAGHFAIYPPKGEKYRLLVSHPNFGFNLTDDDSLSSTAKVALIPWAKLTCKLGAEDNSKQSADLRTRPQNRPGYPDVSINQYWEDLKLSQPADTFSFTHVPAILQTNIGRSFAEHDGGSVSISAASVDLLPGDDRQIDLGPMSDKQREWLQWNREQFNKLHAPPKTEAASESKQGADAAPPRSIPALFAAEQKPDDKKPPTILSYGDGKPDGKKSYGGSGQMIRFELPEGMTKIKGIRIHGSRYGLPQPPDENFEITFLSDKRDEVLHTETPPYKLFKRGKETWVRIPFEKEVELPKTFWIALDFNAEQTKGVYVSYDTSTKGQYSRVGKAGDEKEPKETDFGGDWMVQVLLAPAK